MRRFDRKEQVSLRRYHIFVVGLKNSDLEIISAQAAAQQPADRLSHQRKRERRCRALIVTFLIDVAADLSSKRGDQLEAGPVFVRAPHAASVVRNCQTGLTIADNSYQGH
jgi:hypothetical protein